MMSATDTLDPPLELDPGDQLVRLSLRRGDEIILRFSGSVPPPADIGCLGTVEEIHPEEDPAWVLVTWSDGTTTPLVPSRDGWQKHAISFS